MTNAQNIVNQNPQYLRGFVLCQAQRLDVGCMLRQVVIQRGKEMPAVTETSGRADEGAQRSAWSDASPQEVKRFRLGPQGDDWWHHAILHRGTLSH